MARGKHRETKAEDILQGKLTAAAPEQDDSPPFAHCDECGHVVGGSAEVCACRCGLCAAINGETVREKARARVASGEHPNGEVGKPRRSSSGIASSYGGYAPKHCSRPACVDVRTRVHSGCPQWCCACDCGGCKSASQAFLAAASMEHCGSPQCLKRLTPGQRGAPYPACACGCPECNAIAVTAGVRPASYVPPVTDEEVDWILLSPPAEPAPSPRVPARAALEAMARPAARLELEEELPSAEEEVGQTRQSTAPRLELEEEPEESDAAHSRHVETRTNLEAMARPAARLELEEEPVDPLFERAPLGDAMVVTAAAAAAATTHRLRVLVENHSGPGLSDPPTTGSACGLMPSCLYWLREDVPRDERETNEDALFGTIGHMYAEEYAQGTMTSVRQDELEQLVPDKKRDAWVVAVRHVRRWLDEHRGAVRGPGVAPLYRAEIPVAYDPDSGIGLELGAYILAIAPNAGPRAYATRDVWLQIREATGLGPRTIPSTLDLVLIVDGIVHVYDWCFGRTDKRAQLTMAALSLSEIHRVDEIHTHALYVDDDGVREETVVFDGPKLDKAAARIKAYLDRAEASPEPLAGMHCVAHHCRVRKSCPITTSAVMGIVLPARAAALDVPPPFGLSDRIESDEYAEWLLPVWTLAGHWYDQRKKDLEAWADSRPQAAMGIITKRAADGTPLKCWRGVPRAGSPRFSRAHAEAMLKILGATPEQVEGCYVTSAQSKTHREVNAPAGPRERAR